jgi:hypothetical protein
MSKKSTLIIDCYTSETCSSEDALRTNVSEAMGLESVDGLVQFHKVNYSEALKLGLMGSPSILINGSDILPGEIPGLS